MHITREGCQVPFQLCQHSVSHCAKHLKFSKASRTYALTIKTKYAALEIKKGVNIGRTVVASQDYIAITPPQSCLKYPCHLLYQICIIPLDSPVSKKRCSSMDQGKDAFAIIEYI